MSIKLYRTAKLSFAFAVVISLAACAGLSNKERGEQAVSVPSHRLPPATSTQTDLAVRAQTDVLAKMALGFSLPELNNSDVTQFEHWSATHPTYLNNLFARAEPFLHYVVNEIERRGLPMELALLPAVESAYKTDAVSRSKAVGLWQFVSATGKEYGLEQTWWYDGRRDVVASTNAALTYIEKLYNRFDQDWFLALAAYNVGQGNLARSISKNESKRKPTHYTALDLRTETRRYVPKLIALRNIIRDPQKYGVELRPIPMRSTFTALNLGDSQIDFKAFAQQAGYDFDALMTLNAGFLRWMSPPPANKSFSLLIPSVDPHRVAQAKQLLSARPTVEYQSYVIASGDTLGRIARRFGTTVYALQQANNLSGNTIGLGKTLLIPKQVGVVASSSVESTNSASNDLASSLTQLNTSQSNNAITQHRVAHGDTLWSIARRYSVSVSDLLSWNTLDINVPLQLGQLLKLLP